MNWLPWNRNRLSAVRSSAMSEVEVEIKHAIQLINNHQASREDTDQGVERLEAALRILKQAQKI